jgi:hypothetical protein
VALPALEPNGDLPVGLHECAVDELLARFGRSSARRRLIGLRLRRILGIPSGLREVARVVVYGSFVSLGPEPNDVDLFLVVEDSFRVGTLSGEARLVFEHVAAQAHFGASIFWASRSGCLPNEEEMVLG